MRSALVILGGLLMMSASPFVAKAQFDPFDSYGAISWEDEKAHLDNFAIALQHDSGSIGYIIVYAGRRACVDEAKDRALRAKKYVVKTRGIQKSRIKWIDGGYREELIVILQPAPRGAPELTASPTLKPREVHIIKNCKPKASNGPGRRFSTLFEEGSRDRMWSKEWKRTRGFTLYRENTHCVGFRCLH